MDNLEGSIDAAARQIMSVGTKWELIMFDGLDMVEQSRKDVTIQDWTGHLPRHATLSQDHHDMLPHLSVDVPQGPVPHEDNSVPMKEGQASFQLPVVVQNLESPAVPHPDPQNDEASPQGSLAPQGETISPMESVPYNHEETGDEAILPVQQVILPPPQEGQAMVPLLPEVVQAPEERPAVPLLHPPNDDVLELIRQHATQEVRVQTNIGAIRVPGPNKIMTGPGGHARHDPECQRFRQIVDLCVDEYHRRHGMAKTEWSWQITNYFLYDLEMEFLERGDDQVWKVISNRQARKKVTERLRGNRDPAYNAARRERFVNRRRANQL